MSGLRRGRTWILPIAAVACVACCAVPLTVVAGWLAATAGFLVLGWLPALVVLVLGAAPTTWYLLRRRHRPHPTTGPVPIDLTPKQPSPQA